MKRAVSAKAVSAPKTGAHAPHRAVRRRFLGVRAAWSRKPAFIPGSPFLFDRVKKLASRSTMTPIVGMAESSQRLRLQTVGRQLGGRGGAARPCAARVRCGARDTRPKPDELEDPRAIAYLIRSAEMYPLKVSPVVDPDMSKCVERNTRGARSVSAPVDFRKAHSNHPHYGVS